MAAVDPSESPKRQKTPADEVETSGDKAEAAESGCSLEEEDGTTCDDTTERPGDEQAASVGSDSACNASHSEVSVGSGAGADKTTCKSPEHMRSAENMAEAPDDEQRAFDCFDPEDDDMERITPEERTECDLRKVEDNAVLQQHSHVGQHLPDVNSVQEQEHSTKEDTEKVVAEDAVGDGPEEPTLDEDQLGRGADADPTAKQRKCRLVCKECGKRFNRREMFNLHRHFHAHEDELSPLTCKQCGLTFQHRSSLIKHRNEHKVKEEPVEVQTTERDGFECAECEKTFATVEKLRQHSCGNTVEKPYHCPLCRQEFQFRYSVTKHMMNHSQEPVVTCQECNRRFPNYVTLRYHQRYHAALKPYECPECGMVFKHYSVMEDHRRRHSDGTRSHLCNICGKTFKYSSLLHQHQYLHTGQKPFRCPECGKAFAFAQNMNAHCRQHRLGKPSHSSEQQPCKQPESVQESSRGPGKENTHQSEQPNRTFNCPLCPQTYSLPANLRAHMLVHEAEYEMLERTPNAPKEINWESGYTCPHCPCVYHQESSLNLHILSYHKSIAQYIEKAAPPPTTQSDPLSSDCVQGKWKSDGVSVNLYKCSECGKTFRHRSVLELHMRIHSKDKLYQCRVCGKSFRFSSQLQQHLIIHTGKKPYKCPDCGKDFAFMQNMKTHQKLHQQKPFRCTSCRKGYSDETQLQQHMLSHNGDKPHKCEMCDKSFALAYLLRDHMNTHTGERPHRCDECPKSFSWFSSLLVHQKIHARKRQSLSQFNSLPGGARMRGRGGRGRRGGKITWGWSRALGGGSGVVNSQMSSYPVPSREAEINRRADQLHLNSRQHEEQWLPELHPQPVQWKVDGGEVLLVPSSLQPNAGPQHAQFDSPPHTGLQQNHQRSPGWADGALVTQSGSTSAQGLPKPVTWSSTPTSTSSVEHSTSGPSYIDGAALWSIRPAPLAISQGASNELGQEHQQPRGAPESTQKETPTPPKKEDSEALDSNNPQAKQSTVSQPEKPWNGCEPQQQQDPGLAGASTSSQKDQSSSMPTATPVSHGAGSTQTQSGIPKTNSPEKLANNQEPQQTKATSGWAAVQSQSATQKVPISLQYEPHRFAQGMGAPVWSFQSSSVGAQALLTGQLKPGNGQELQQQPVVTGTQIIINQAPSFFSPALAPLPALALPGPHPLHAVTVGALSSTPHPKILLTPQAVLTERPHLPQTLALPQLAPPTEPQKLGPRLPFAPERLLQCMICGCTLPRELDLQMHYLQHAQGEI